MKNTIRWIPSINDLVKSEEIQKLKKSKKLKDDLLKHHVRLAVNCIREKVLKEEQTLDSKEHATLLICNLINKNINHYLSKQIEPVINGTGTVLHTNLGRARLSEKAVQHVTEVARNYSTLEFNTITGGRGSRHSLVEDYIKDLTGAEAAIVVNNNAASVYMVMSAFAKNREVIVSRGELVEIGGSFRVSSIMEESGATLKEVGTTNKTHLFDYERAINEETSMLMKVHTSNFHMVGFTKNVSREDLVTLANQHQVMTFEDLGSGMVYDLKRHEVGQEPLVKEVLAKGIDLVSFSGDKLFGGPQVGIIAGKKHFIDHLKQHQLARVLRVDKMTYAALETTLKQWIMQDYDIPTLRDILQPKEELESRVIEFIERYKQYHNPFLTVKEVGLTSKVGGGTLPEVELDSYGVSLSSERLTAEEIKQQLRKMTPPIICRVERGEALLDFRTMTEEEEAIVLKELVNFTFD